MDQTLLEDLDSPSTMHLWQASNNLESSFTTASIEVLINFILDIYNTFQNTIQPNPKERFYLSLPNIYLEWFKIKFPKNPTSEINPIELCIHDIKSIQGKIQLESFVMTNLNQSSSQSKLPEDHMITLYYSGLKKYLNTSFE